MSVSEIVAAAEVYLAQGMRGIKVKAMIHQDTIVVLEACCLVVEVTEMISHIEGFDFFVATIDAGGWS